VEISDLKTNPEQISQKIRKGIYLDQLEA